MQEINYQTYVKPSDYVKFSPGVNRIVVVSKGYLRKLHSMKTSRGFINLGECKGAGCEHCAKGTEPKTKFTWIVLMPVNKEVRIMDAGTMIGDQICNIAKEKAIDPNGYEFTVQKAGTGLKTEYTVTLGGKAVLTPQDQELVEYGKKFLVNKHFK